MNFKHRISNVVLDEVHSISNWGHSFKPDYLMLSDNLQKCFEKTRFLGFTATAEYKVVMDVSRQLNISNDKIINPIQLDTNKYSLGFLSDDDKTINEIANRITTLVDLNKTGMISNKLLIFSESETYRNEILEKLQNETESFVDCFKKGNSNSYWDFAKGHTDVLIADSGLGVGINLPLINEVIHLGTPISKSQYVQEIGRSGRNAGVIKSNVYFREKKNLSKEE